MFNIKRPHRYRLEKAPLAQVLVQVRFPLVAHFQELGGIASLQDELRDLLPYLDSQQIQVALPIHLNNTAPISSMVAWRFTGDDEWALALESGSAALFVGEGYRGYEDFASRFARVLKALAKTNRIARCDRLGVRFINIAEPAPGDGRAWERWFRRELLGWVSADVLGEHSQLSSSLTQTQLTAKPTGLLASFPADIQALIRHGVVPGATGIPLESGSERQVEQESYVLDIDLFVQAPQRFDPEQLLGQFEALHAQIDAFFHWSLTDAGKADFGMVEL